MKIDVLLAPSLIDDGVSNNTLCVVIDVLRATTTISVAVASGAAEIYPCIDTAEVRKYVQLRARNDYLLGGEENCRLIPGFDLGNSPLEYLDSQRIQGKTIFFTTTNGTTVIRKAYSATQNPIFIAALVNLSLVSSAMAQTTLNKTYSSITIICSGRHGKISLEDVICAGLIISGVKEELTQAAITPDLTDSALLSEKYAHDNIDRIFDLVLDGEAGRNLQQIGYTADIEFCCRRDTIRSIPIFDGNCIKGQT